MQFNEIKGYSFELCALWSLYNRLLSDIEAPGKGSIHIEWIIHVVRTKAFIVKRFSLKYRVGCRKAYAFDIIFLNIKIR